MYFLLGLVASTALYGILSLILCVFGLHIDTPTIFDAAAQPVGFAGWFQKYMSLSLVAYPVLMAVHVLMVQAGVSRRGWSPYRGAVIFQVPSWVLADLTNPFRGLIALKGAAKVIDTTGARRAASWGTQVLHLVWSLALWAWLALGITVLALK